MTHRGPDGFGDWWSARYGVYLTHCRLAIIDLSDAGRQPMENEDGTVRITFNGEIYNYRELRTELVAAGHSFRSQTDTEVIIRAWKQWGTSCVDQLRGIFAFAIFDERRQQITVARDRLGVKPLYYRLYGSELIFASEPRAILAMPNVTRSIIVASALQFLRYSYTSGNDCIWNGIKRLPAGAVLSYQMNNATVHASKYWRLPSQTQTVNWANTVDEAEALISDATKEQLVRDVPVGVFLSGGIDSSLVSTYSASSSPSINSFCVDFSGWDHSEAEDARIVAETIGTTHHACVVDQAKCSFADPEIAEKFFLTWDEPLVDPAIIPTWHISRMIRNFVTVALSGDGGDEIFAVYRWYSGVQGAPRRRVAWFAKSIRQSMGFGRLWPRGCANAFEYFHLLHCPSFSTAELIALFPDWQREIQQLYGGLISRRLMSQRDRAIRRWQRIDAESFLVDNNLARVDRASMMHGLEVRVPLLDHRLVEFTFRLPDEFWLRGGVQKTILRELVARHLPERIRTRPKQGFSFPFGDFVSMGEMATTVENGTLASSALLNREAFRNWNSDPKQVSSLKLWLIYTFEQWAKHWLFRSSSLPGESMTAGLEAVR